MRRLRKDFAVRSSGPSLTKKRTAIFWVLIALSLAWTAFIFSNSLKCADDSLIQSGGFVDFVIDSILRVPDEKMTVDFAASVTNFVRKLAHFTEFAILSSLLFFVFFVRYEKKARCFAFSMVITFFVALTDEILQNFSVGRACRFTDVLIDCSGGAFACAAFCIILFAFESFKKRHTTD